MIIDKKLMNDRKFRPIHTDKIRNSYRVTYDDSIIIRPAKRQLTQSAFMLELAQNSDIELI